MNKATYEIKPNSLDIISTRVFDVPRERLFAVMMDPAHIPNWWGPKQYHTVVDKMDVRPGGMWRFVQRGANGDESAFHGVYHDIVAPERTVQTFEFEGMPGHVLMETMTLTEQDGKTVYQVVSVFQSVADRDGMVASGMEQGSSEGMDRLEELVKSL